MNTVTYWLNPAGDVRFGSDTMYVEKYFVRRDLPTPKPIVMAS